MSKQKKQKKASRPERVVEVNGIRTYDSRLCCGHAWTDISSDKKNGTTILKKYCQLCGATATAENGRIVEYDADADFLKKLDEEERRATEANAH